jgi:hypothetical protein
MGGMVPLGDASRLPARVPVVTAGIIVVNVVVFLLWRVCRPAGWHTYRTSATSFSELPLRACSRVSVKSRESLAVS